MITDKQLKDIKIIIQDFISENGFERKEEDVQTSYTIRLLKILDWKSSHWKINTSQEIKTNERPDILLKGTGGGTIFVIESKAPSESLDGRYQKNTFIDQLCKYIGSEGVSWGVLTNFKEWRIYNAHAYKINKTIFNTPLRIIGDDKKIVCSDEQLKDFFNLIEYNYLTAKRGKFSNDAVYYPAQEEIKEIFFQNLKTWRAELRNNIHKKHHHELSTEEIDNQTQRILDRLIFMEFCYDKKIIFQDYLGAVVFSSGNFYDELIKKFRGLDEQFNSELFRKDKCDLFEITNEVLEDIIKGVSRIDFSTLNTHIIGEVYENYLGELLKKGKSKIVVGSDTKEHLKRKKQGIYYTPDYIVNYIVENTIGELIKKCKTEKDIEKIKVIDPACGSGSFLIRAFEIFYEAYKNIRPKKQLSIFDELNIRKKILLHNLFGIDLDERAVEIAKLNLLLKGLEGLEESHVTGRKILPNLSLNIRCGNSLVSGKYEDETHHSETENQLDLIFEKKSEYKNDIHRLLELKDKFYLEEDNAVKDSIIEQVHKHEYKINKYLNKNLESYFKESDNIKPFNYEVAFCEVMKRGGFDCVIGNPPYVQLSMEKDFSKGYKNYLSSTFHSSMGRFNTFGFFVKKSILLIRPNGLSGLIIPNTILTQDYYKELRKYLLENTSLRYIVNYNGMAFKDAVVENVTLITERGHAKNNKITLIDYEGDKAKETNINQSVYDETFSNQFIKASDKNQLALKNKFFKCNHFLLGKDINVNQAIALKSDRAKYLFDSKRGENYKPVIDGRNIERYQLNWDNEYLKYDVDAIHSCKRTDIFECDEKLFFRRVGSSLKATYDNKQYYALNTIIAMTLKDKVEISLKYILGVFNSTPLNYYYTSYLKSTKKVFSEIQARQIKQLPIPLIDLSNQKQKQIHDRIVLLVDEMIDLNKYPDKNKNKIQATDSEIDDEVYKLYNIDDKERMLIEGSLK